MLFLNMVDYLMFFLLMSTWILIFVDGVGGVLWDFSDSPEANFPFPFGFGWDWDLNLAWGLSIISS